GLLRTCVYNSFRSYLYTSKELVNLDLRGQLEKISAPTLLIAGEHDGIFPVSVSQEMQKQIPNSKLIVLPNTNHVSILNNPPGIANAVLDFLKTLS
ncbi:MAG TPA: alpha/beta hydrolase, partial [Candidatus Paceibacterota bacterium]|nr:alpha/beta hydrolase [Candidatus Paceibacterota bacterium]